MTTMIVEIYDALLGAGAPEDKARRAAEAMAGHEDRFNRLDTAVIGVETRLGTRLDRLDAKVDQVEARLNNKIDRLDAKIDRVEVSLRGEQVVVRWMLGTSIAFEIAMILKLFVH